MSNCTVAATQRTVHHGSNVLLFPHTPLFDALDVVGLDTCCNCTVAATCVDNKVMIKGIVKASL